MKVNYDLNRLARLSRRVHYRIDMENRDKAVVFYNGTISKGTTHASAITDNCWYRADLFNEINPNDFVSFAHELSDGIIVLSEYDNNYDDILCHSEKQLLKLARQYNITLVTFGFGKTVNVINKRR